MLLYRLKIRRSKVFIDSGVFFMEITKIRVIFVQEIIASVISSAGHVCFRSFYTLFESFLINIYQLLYLIGLFIITCFHKIRNSIFIIVRTSRFKTCSISSIQSFQAFGMPLAFISVIIPGLVFYGEVLLRIIKVRYLFIILFSISVSRVRIVGSPTGTKSNPILSGIWIDRVTGIDQPHYLRRAAFVLFSLNHFPGSGLTKNCGIQGKYHSCRKKQSQKLRKSFTHTFYSHFPQYYILVVGKKRHTYPPKTRYI